MVESPGNLVARFPRAAASATGALAPIEISIRSSAFERAVETAFTATQKGTPLDILHAAREIAGYLRQDGFRDPGIYNDAAVGVTLRHAAVMFRYRQYGPAVDLAMQALLADQRSEARRKFAVKTYLVNPIEHSIRESETSVPIVTRGLNLLFKAAVAFHEHTRQTASQDPLYSEFAEQIGTVWTRNLAKMAALDPEVAIGVALDAASRAPLDSPMARTATQMWGELVDFRATVYQCGTLMDDVKRAHFCESLATAARTAQHASETTPDGSPLKIVSAQKWYSYVSELQRLSSDKVPSLIANIDTNDGLSPLAQAAYRLARSASTVATRGNVFMRLHALGATLGQLHLPYNHCPHPYDVKFLELVRT